MFYADFQLIARHKATVATHFGLVPSPLFCAVSLSDDLMRTMDADRHHRSYRPPSGKSALSEAANNNNKKKKPNPKNHIIAQRKTGRHKKPSRCKSSTGI